MRKKTFTFATFLPALWDGTSDVSAQENTVLGRFY